MRGASFFWALLTILIASPTRAQIQGTKPFYEGRTLQIVVSSGPGATTDIAARLVGRHLGKQIPGNPGTIVRLLQSQSPGFHAGP